MVNNIFTSNNIVITNDVSYSDGQWRASTKNPYFIFKYSFLPKKGWWKVKLRIRADANILPKLYFDFGNDFNERQSISLKHIRGDLYSATIKLPFEVKNLRFDPLEEPAIFSVDLLCFKHLSIFGISIFALKQVLRIFIKNPKNAIPKIFKSAKSFLRSTKIYDITSASAEDRQQTAFEIWQEKFDYKPEKHNEGLNRNLDSLDKKPKISIIMPVYNTDKVLLDKAINSVRNQLYQNWELCICNDKSSKKYIKEALDEWQKIDDRIKVKHRQQNGHISQASNSALELVTSDWVALLDHDDVLRANALAEIVMAIHENPEAEVFYSDEDKLDATEKRYDPHFKPDFSPDLFRSMNYLNHLTVHKTHNIKRVGGWRDEYIGSQDYDLNLRIWESIRDEQIIHIPKILYHWRAIKGSTALDSREKDYAVDAGLQALNAHLKRVDVAAQAERLAEFSHYRVKYDLPKDLPLVSIIISTTDNVDSVRRCITSIYEKSGYSKFEIILVNNNSKHEDSFQYFEMLTQKGKARILNYPHAFNQSAIKNFAVEHAKGSIIGFMNFNLEAISENWLVEMVSLVCRDGIGCVGAKLYHENNTVQHGGIILGLDGIAGPSHKYLSRWEPGYFARMKALQNLSAVTGACLFVKKSIFLQLGGFNEESLKTAYNDVDFCLKLRAAGYLNIWTPFAELYYYQNISTSTGTDSEIDYMRRKWFKDFSVDPYYSPNLSITGKDFSIKTEDPPYFL